MVAALACGALLAPVGAARAEPDRTTRTEQAPPSAATAERLASTGAHAVAASATQTEDDTPLEVEIDSLTPSYVPEKGTVSVGGTVTNRSDETFTGINLHAFIGDAPITSVAELAAERKRDPADFVGERITVPGSFDTVDALAPGESTRFQLEVTRSQLGVSEPGVYWFGVHALGDSDVPRDQVADGRARTFLPLVPGKDVDAVPTALVIPVRHLIRHAADGSVEDVEGWAQTLGEGGLLRAQVDFGASAGSQPVSWLVDPAVIDTVTALTEGNLPRSLDDTPPATEGQDGGSSGPGAGASAPASGDGSSAPGDGDATGEPEIPVNEATQPGLDWLERFGAAVEGNEVLGVPYGDLDVSGAAAHQPTAYQRARVRTGDTLEPWGFPMSRAVGPPAGYLSTPAYRMLRRDGTILVSDRSFRGPAPASARVAGRQVTVTSSAAALGGPGPNDPLATIPLRQQVLAEAALRALSPDPEPLVVLLPSSWHPDGGTGFFSGLEVPWVRLTTVAGATSAAGPGPDVDPHDLNYPTRQAVRALDAANFTSAARLRRLGQLLQQVLVRNDEVGSSVRDESLTGLSYSDRNFPNAARATTDRSSLWISEQLGSIRVQAPRAVTLSSTSGKFSATVVNGLDHPVRVRIKSIADAPLEISETEPLDIPAKGRVSVLLEATTEQLGVHNVQLLVTTENGAPLGSSDTLPIRSNQVSNVIWLILGTGVALLFGAIAVRLVRRIRAARS
ncbi:DUF6049 family protein [Nocardioides taihuensis]|uniref:DUF6049 family protein n=1 Tax=Nocardioides taihuensis TaxID=1835606 RepID=A0ABW0BG51_9ACTN